MARDFKTLVRINDWAVDQKRRALGEQLRQLENLQGLLQQLKDEIVNEQKLATDMPTEAGLTYGAYAVVAIERREDLVRRIDLQERAVNGAREDLRDAYLELKKYEIAEERRGAKVDADLAREEQAVLDEIGIIGHTRKQ